VKPCTDRCRWAAGTCWNPDRDVRRIHIALHRMRGNRIAADLRDQIDEHAATWLDRLAAHSRFAAEAKHGPITPKENR